MLLTAPAGRISTTISTHRQLASPRCVVGVIAMIAALAIWLPQRWGSEWHTGSLKGPVLPMTVEITPAHGTRGETLNVSMHATTGAFTRASTPNLGPGVAVRANRAVNAATLSARIQIANDSPAGYRRIWAVTPGADSNRQLRQRRIPGDR
jgi:hypothetical protein